MVCDRKRERERKREHMGTVITEQRSRFSVGGYVEYQQGAGCGGVFALGIDNCSATSPIANTGRSVL